MSSLKTMFWHHASAGGIFLSSLLLLAACTGDSTPQKTGTPQVNLAIWGNYLSEETRKAFTEETGIRINITNYSSNEELLAKIQAGQAGIDVAVPSDYMVDIMIKLGLLEALDKAQIPSAAHLDQEVLAQPFDSKNAYSLPYAWATAGIAVNRKYFSEPITSWKDLLENPKLAGKFALLDDVREVTGAVLKMQGESVNTTDEAALARAKEKLLDVKKRVKMFTSDTVAALKSREVVAAQAYSTDALQANLHSQDEIEYVIPSEGGTRAIDNLVVLKGSANAEQAHRLINYLLTKEQNEKFVRNIRAGPVVKGVRESLPEELRKNKGLFPSNEVLSKLERVVDLGEKNRLYEDLWMSVKSR